MGAVIVIIIASLFVGSVWMFFLKSFRKMAPKAKYDKYYLGVTLKSMGYTLKENAFPQYCRQVTDRTTLCYTLSTYGLMASLEFEKYSLTEEQSEQIAKTIKDLIETNQIENSIDTTGVSNNSVMLILKTDETIDSYILNKLETILNELVSIVEPTLK